MADVVAVSAGVLYTMAIIILLGIRSWQHFRATGAAGFNGFRRETGTAASLAAAGFVLALVSGILSPVLIHLDLAAIWPGSEGTRTLTAVGGAVVMVGGVWLGSAAQYTMGSSWRIGVDPSERTELVTRGLFATIRNPIFTAMLVIQLGATLMAPTWLSIIGASALLVGCQVQTRLVEEPYLLTTHGTRHRGYAARAGRFVPLLGRLRREAP